MLILIGKFVKSQEVYTNVFYGFLLWSRRESITLLRHWAMESNRSNDQPTHTDFKHPTSVQFIYIYIYCYQNVQCSVFEVTKITDGKKQLGREADDSSSTKVVYKNTWRFYLHYLPPCAFMESSGTTLTSQFTSLPSVQFCLYASSSYIPIKLPD